MKRVGRLEITTKIGCSCNCVYCPQQLLISEYLKKCKDPKTDIMLSLERFKTCINKLPENTRIDFSGMAEPWLNPECTKMVKYAYEKKFPIAIYTTLVGMKMEDFNQIKDIPFEEFILHIPDDKSNTHINVTKEYINLLDHITKYEKNGKKLVTGFSCHAGIHPDILTAIPEDSRLITEIHNRAGNINEENVVNKKSIGEIVCINCELDLNHNVLLPDGKLLLCCMDYGMKHVLGNLLEQSYDEIYESEESNYIRCGLKDEQKDILCRDCINSRNINEIYDDYRLYLEWNNKLNMQNEERIRELKTYVNWNKQLQEQILQFKSENEKAEQRYNDRIKEANDYKDWVKNLEKQILGFQKEYDKLTQVYNERVEELMVYKKWVDNLQNKYNNKD
ncbi:SPASM domain-containing protein [Clostridium cagae]|uniref:radical SAM/SPASM domain-containing protein n=1 Tax=Clostridium cagae TaxID=2080751 RepID=UPI003F76831E